MVYVALLRGINVGGNNKINMKLLKQAFEQSGMSNVVTYINSGNIIFTHHSYSKHELSQILEAVIMDTFHLSIKVLILHLMDMEIIMASLPEFWTNDDQMKSDVLFLWEDSNNESILEQLAIKPNIDTVIYVPGAILWSVSREHVTKSGLVTIIKTDLYRQTTIRNVNTTRKIYELMLASNRSSINQ